MRGPQCRMSILRNGNVACLSDVSVTYFPQCHMSNLRKAYVTCHYIFLPPCRMSLSSMWHVEFKNCPCRPVDFRGLGPLGEISSRALEPVGAVFLSVTCGGVAGLINKEV